MLEGMWKKGNIPVLLAGMYIERTTTEWRSLKQPGLELPYEPTIPLPGLYPEKTITGRDSCTPGLVAALFIIARTWKQPRYPSTDEWMQTLWDTYTMEYYAAIKKTTHLSQS